MFLVLHDQSPAALCLYYAYISTTSKLQVTVHLLAADGARLDSFHCTAAAPEEAYSELRNVPELHDALCRHPLPLLSSGV